MPPEEVQEALDVILRTAFKMTDIVNALLVLASTRRLDEVEVEPLDMAAILLDVQERLAHAIAESQAMLVMPGEWPLALGVGLWVEEVWVNYISNAIKYGGTPPRVELGAELQESGMVRFWVRDNGHGVDPKMRDLLFVEFTAWTPAGRRGTAWACRLSSALSRSSAVRSASTASPGRAACSTLRCPPRRRIRLRPSQTAPLSPRQ